MENNDLTSGYKLSTNILIMLIVSYVNDEFGQNVSFRIELLVAILCVLNENYHTTFLEKMKTISLSSTAPHEQRAVAAGYINDTSIYHKF